MRVATVARAVMGAACVTMPSQVLAAVGGLDRDDVHTRTVVRVLGARQLVQSATDVAFGRRTRALDAAVDLVHAASMVGVAAWSTEHRRSALTSAVLASATAALELVPEG